MAARSVAAPDGRTWVVRRTWVRRLGDDSVLHRFRARLIEAWRHRKEHPEGEKRGIFGVFADNPLLGGFALVIALIVIFVLVPLLVTFVDVVVIVVIALVGLVGRFVFRRPWTVEAKANDATRLRWRVVGWRASGERIDEVADGLERGDPPAAG